MSAAPAIPGLQKAPQLGAWVTPDPARRRLVFHSGKVEIGQHVHTALRLLAAEGCGLAPGFLEIADVSTARSPDEGLTAGSLSIQHGGAALFSAARGLMVQLHAAAALRLNCAAEALRLDPDTARFYNGDRDCDLFDCLDGLDWQATVTPVLPEVAGDGAAMAQDPPPERIAGAIAGTAPYVQDLAPEGMLQATALRGIDPVRLPGGPGLTELPGGGWLLRDGGFAAVIAEQEHRLLRLAEELRQQADRPDDPPDPHDGPVRDWCHRVRSIGFAVEPPAGGQPAGAATGRQVAFSASRPFLLHGSIAPSCALACWQGADLQVWTHSQGIFQLRAAMAQALEIAADRIVLHHVPSAGCYGHTAADDAAMDAALIARAFPGRPVRVAWSRLDEMRHAPVGAPMAVTLSAGLDVDGRIVDWQHEIWSGSHGQRPGSGGAVNLLAAMERDPALRPDRIGDIPAAAGSGAARNLVPPYRVAMRPAQVHLFQELPVRSSALRGLGAHLNVVAIEAVIEFLAAEAGVDPVAFRLRHLDDPRARAVVERMGQAAAALQAGLSADGTEAVGMAYSRYKNSAALAGVAVHLRLEDAPRLVAVHAVVDAGLVVSPEGARSQIEGGIVQAAGWTLCEGVLLRNGRLDCTGWEDYPLQGWADIPRIEVDFLRPDIPDPPPLGVGECMQGPVSAAIVNALGRILGAPVGDLPLNRDRLVSVMV